MKPTATAIRKRSPHRVVALNSVASSRLAVFGSNRIGARLASAIREADEDETVFNSTGKHLLKRQSLSQFIAEVNSL